MTSLHKGAVSYILNQGLNPQAGPISTGSSSRSALSYQSTNHLPAEQQPLFQLSPTPERADTPMSSEQEQPSPATRESSLVDAESPHGTSTLVPREFKCLFTENCTTNQYLLKDSRKVISDMFGRNKGCTSKLPEFRFCRKHYQRASYKKDTWQYLKLNLVRQLLSRNEQLNPGVTYSVSLKKSERQRLSEFYQQVHNRERTEDLDKEYRPGPVTDNKTYRAPLNILIEITQKFGGSGKSKKHIEGCVAYIKDCLDQDRCKEVPNVEFLMEEGVEHSTEQPTRSPRINRKGAIQKPK